MRTHQMLPGCDHSLKGRFSSGIETRHQQETSEFRATYATRTGIEGTNSQSVRALR
jgi:hypothetical protein